MHVTHACDTAPHQPQPGKLQLFDLASVPVSIPVFGTGNPVKKQEIKNPKNPAAMHKRDLSPFAMASKVPARKGIVNVKDQKQTGYSWYSIERATWC